ncbi:MAG: hypothetical protein DMF63_01795 [Acidobacteria bacterium]|nr:MAG: hypothetical protein DMF63_01795 [Acidobacteriota bacterium]
MKKIFLLIIILTAIGTATPAQSMSLDGRQWKLIEINGSRVGDSAAYLQLDTNAGRFSGNAGCNRMFGSVEIEGRQIAFSNAATTRMACLDWNAQSNEKSLLDALKSVESFRQRGDTLELMNKRRVLIKLVAPVKDGPIASDLQDKKWMLDAIGTSKVGEIGQTAFIVFDKDKASAGRNSSCNVFGGSFSAAGSKLTITNVISTMRACIEDDRMDIERKFLDGLRATNRYKIKNHRLMLYRDDRLLLTFAGGKK